MLFDNVSAVLILASESGAGGANAFPVEPDLALWTLIIFVVLVFVLGKFAWKPIMEGLELREKGIADKIDSAEKAKQESLAKLEAYEQKLAGAADEASALIAEARNDALAAKDKILAEAADQAQRTRERALADIEAAKDAAARELAEKSVDSAVELAGSIVGRSLNKQDHVDLIDKSVQGFGSGA